MDIFAHENENKSVKKEKVSKEKASIEELINNNETLEGKNWEKANKLLELFNTYPLSTDYLEIREINGKNIEKTFIGIEKSGAQDNTITLFFMKGELEYSINISLLNKSKKERFYTYIREKVNSKFNRRIIGWHETKEKLKIIEDNMKKLEDNELLEKNNWEKANRLLKLFNTYSLSTDYLEIREINGKKIEKTFIRIVKSDNNTISLSLIKGGGELEYSINISFLDKNKKKRFYAYKNRGVNSEHTNYFVSGRKAAEILKIIEDNMKKYEKQEEGNIDNLLKQIDF